VSICRLEDVSPYTSVVLAFEFVRLLPQDFSPESFERSLDSLPALRVSCDGPSGTHGASEESSLTTDEETASAEKEVRSQVSQECRPQVGCDVWYGFCASIGELDVGRLLPGFESIEHGSPTAANAKCHEEAYAKTDEGANCGMVAQGGRGFFEGVAVLRPEATQKLSVQRYPKPLILVSAVIRKTLSDTKTTSKVW